MQLWPLLLPLLLPCSELLHDLVSVTLPVSQGSNEGHGQDYCCAESTVENGTSCMTHCLEISEKYI